MRDTDHNSGKSATHLLLIVNTHKYVLGTQCDKFLEGRNNSRDQPRTKDYRLSDRLWSIDYGIAYGLKTIDYCLDSIQCFIRFSAFVRFGSCVQYSNYSVCFLSWSWDCIPGISILLYTNQQADTILSRLCDLLYDTLWIIDYIERATLWTI